MCVCCVLLRIEDRESCRVSRIENRVSRIENRVSRIKNRVSRIENRLSNFVHFGFPYFYAWSRVASQMRAVVEYGRS